MKDHRFVELLNLYIDRQITAEETAELEAEIQRDPKRQAVYRQYCQIHTATKLVYESFRAGATEPAVGGNAGAATVELFENRRRRTHWTYYAGGLAAAACLTLVFVRVLGPAAPAPTLAAARAPAVVATPAAPEASVPMTVVAQVEPAANPISLRNASSSPDYSTMLVALREQDEERALAGERWQGARPVSLFDDNLFDAKPATPASEQRSTRARTPTAGQVEMTVFQFQR